MNEIRFETFTEFFGLWHRLGSDFPTIPWDGAEK